MADENNSQQNEPQNHTEQVPSQNEAQPKEDQSGSTQPTSQASQQASETPSEAQQGDTTQSPQEGSQNTSAQEPVSDDEEDWADRINEARQQEASEDDNRQDSEVASDAGGSDAQESGTQDENSGEQADPNTGEADGRSHEDTASSEGEETAESTQPTLENMMGPTGILLGDPEQVLEKINNEYGSYTRDEIREAVQNRDPEMLRWILIDSYLNNTSDTVGFLRNALEKIRTDTETDSVGENLEQVTADKTTTKSKHSGHLTGNSARVSTVAALKGVKKVFLYNSGFHVVIKPFQLQELNAFYNSVDLESDELGRTLGGLSFVITDLFIKQKFAELIPLAVVSSNLAGWDEGDTLINNISIHDYETLAWAMSSLLFRKEGIKVPLTCISESCYYKVDDFTVDLDKIRFNRKGVLSKEQMEFVHSSDTRQPEDIQNFISEVEAFNGSVEFHGVTYRLQTPTIGRWLQHGNQILSKIVAYANESRSLRDEKVNNQLVVFGNKMLSPWINEIQYGDPENDGFRTSDLESILEALDMDLDEETTVFNAVSDFIKDSKVSFFCYTSLKCPVCGAEPANGTVDEFTSLDMQYLFFDLTCRKLSVSA